MGRPNLLGLGRQISKLNLHLFTRSQWVMPLFDKMNASLQRERGKGMHLISKSIYLRQISYRFVFSVPKSIGKIYLHVSVWEGVLRWRNTSKSMYHPNQIYKGKCVYNDHCCRPRSSKCGRLYQILYFLLRERPPW